VAVLGPRQYYTGYCLLISREYATEVSQMGLRPSPFPPPLALLAEAIKVCFQPLAQGWSTNCLAIRCCICRGITSPNSRDGPHGPQAIEPAWT